MLLSFFKKQPYDDDMEIAEENEPGAEEYNPFLALPRRPAAKIKRKQKREKA